MKYLVEIDEIEAHLVELQEATRGKWLAAVGPDRVLELVVCGHDEEGAIVVSVNGEKRQFRFARHRGRLFLVDPEKESVSIDVTGAGEALLSANGGGK